MTSANRLLLNIGIKWDNITTVKMAGISPDNALTLLFRAPRLKKCTLCFREVEAPEDDTVWSFLPLNLPLTHTQLESLEFPSYMGDLDMTQFLDGVKLPSIKEFVYMGSDVRLLTSFFLRSPCSLNSLTLFLDHDPTDDDILNLLHIVPSVTNLSFDVQPGIEDDTIMTDRCLRALAITQQAPENFPVLPRLETFSYVGALNFTWPAFLAIFNPAPTSIPDGDDSLVKRPLQNVSLEIESKEAIIIGDDILSRLRKLQATINLKIVRECTGQIIPII